ncbi:MAG: glycosyltransferase family 39 protein [Endomicrobiaceae bacterium]|jgi:hypothetical protein|nr:glycosyltransferase family 39 protein [Endomicrobiaceae bacterium]MDD3729817.1 glycosyltransferase family 39 protein [Endomicrobiaceae bacterium]MDD4165908.1 glycosyltransferase family 39 protein [Endomicrobiaceae bacterium]
MNFKRKTFNSTAAIFLIIAVIYAIGNYIWWTINTPVVFVWYSSVHFYDIFRDGYLFYNAPLLTWIMRLMFYVFGKEHYDLIVIIVNYIFFLISLYFIYKLGVELKDKETGNIAMILFALVPAVYGMSRQYGHQDYHTITAITFNIYCLIKTDYFRDRKWSIWYGVSVGLGLMIKDTFVGYFIPPFVYVLISGLREKIDKTKIINVLIAIVIGSLIAGCHYFRTDIIQKIWYGPVTQTQSVFAFESLRVMTIGLWEELLSPPIFIIFLAGLIYFIWGYSNKYRNIILLWFLIPWMIITFMSEIKVAAYGAGFIPAMILMGAVFISQIQKKYVKRIILILLIVIGSLQYIDYSYIPYIKFFNTKFQFKEYNAGYYNRYNNLMSCNSKQTKLILKLVKYLKNKYPYEKFTIHSSLGLELSAIIPQMNCNRIYCRQWDGNEDILFFDIFIIIGKPMKLEETIEFKIDKMLENPLNAKMVTNELRNELFRKAQYVFSELEINYHIIDIFYLNDNKTNDTKVTLLGRKYKFSEFNEKHAILDVK